MPRPSKHDENSILNAAAMLVSRNGPNAATMTAIGNAIGAPNGSIYHRFRNREELMGRLWLSKAGLFQDRWMQAATHSDARQAGLLAALSMPRTVRADFAGARIMLLHRREDFLSDGWPIEMRKEAERLGQQVMQQLSLMTRRLFRANTEALRRVVTFATIDIPYSAVRRYVGSGQPLPSQTETLIIQAYGAVIDGALSERNWVSSTTIFNGSRYEN